MNEDELKSIGVVLLFKSDNLFYITLLQNKFFDTAGEMVSKFKDIKKAYSDENINDNMQTRKHNEYYYLMNIII